MAGWLHPLCAPRFAAATESLARIAVDARIVLADLSGAFMPTLHQVAYAAFPVLVKTATNQSTITYRDLADQIETHAYYVLPRALGHIWSWCDDHGYPHINALVVSQITGIPGRGYRPYGRPLTGKTGLIYAIKSIHSADGRTWSHPSIGLPRAANSLGFDTATAHAHQAWHRNTVADHSCSG